MKDCKFNRWSLLTLILCAATVISMLLPGSAVICTAGPELSSVYDLSGNYLFNSFTFVFEHIAFALAVINLVICLLSLILRKSPFFAMVLPVIGQLIFIHYTCYIAFAVQYGEFLIFPYLPPVLTVLSLVTAFLAWRSSKNQNT